MPTIALKLVLTPALIAAASLAGRRWGPAISGWLVGLPFTSGPIAFFLALAHGNSFATAAAVGTLAGTLSQTAFCLAYAWVAMCLDTRRNRRPPLLALAAGTLAFVAATILLARFPLPLAPLVPAVVVALLLALRLMPDGRGRGTEGAGAWWPADESAPTGLRPPSPPARASVRSVPTRQPREGRAQARREEAQPAAPPRWDLPLRMAVATAFVVLLTALAPLLGAQLTGLLAPFPLFASVLTVFAHAQQGPAAASGVLRGLLLGLFAFAGFFVVLALLLVPGGIALAFAAALSAALGIQGCSLWLLQRHTR